MYFKILILLLFVFITSCTKQEVISNADNNSKENISTWVLDYNTSSWNILEEVKPEIKNEKFFAVIPHHNLVNIDIDKYYQNLKNKYDYFDNIVIISPNHFTNEYFSFPENSNYCYEDNCVKWKKLSFNTNSELISTFTKTNSWEIYTTEHWIWNHFSFINKYFKETNVYWILLKINTTNDNSLKVLEKNIDDYNFIWKTLFITSVDFSHHVNEKVAVFHDINTINYLKTWFKSQLEVDCPNCLYLAKWLATDDNKNYFNLFNRTSVDSTLWVNSNYENTSHVYWEFEDKINDNKLDVFSGSYSYSKFDNTFTWWLNEYEVNWIFFWDAHFTRRFGDSRNRYSIENYLSCFYSNKDLNRNPNYWHNRLLYSFDFVWANLETSVWYDNECEKSDKTIMFQTNPKYLDSYKNVWFNVFNIANNHIYDCWETWYTATKKHLDEKNLEYFWDWRWNEENILKKEINWTKVAFVWFNDIWRQINEKSKAEKIKKLTEEWYLVIVNIHWWYEYILTSNERQKKIAKLFVDSWAKLIIWHHPHVVQEFETYKWVPIFYSLWNFIFDQPFPETLKWYWLVFSINNTWVKYNILEFVRNNRNYNIDCDSFK